jgi:integrase
VTRARAYIVGSLAASTQQAYASAVNSYIKFCTTERLPAADIWPAQPDTLCLWMAALASRTEPAPPLASTIKRYLGALNTAHEVVGLPAPTRGRGYPRIERIYLGIKKEQGVRSKRIRRPITTALLRQMQPLLDLTHPLDRLLWAAMCTATCALLRLGELTVAPHHASRRTLRLSDLSLITDAGCTVPAHAPLTTLSTLTADRISHVVLYIAASKTDPFGQGARVTVASPLAASALLAMLLTHPRAGDANAPLFAHSDGTPLQRSTVVDCTRALLSRLGLDPLEYAGHSFRRGGASSLAAAGTPDHIIQIMGRWVSDCYKLYIELPTDHLLAATRRM